MARAASRDALAQVSNVHSTVFVGRISRSTEMTTLFNLFAAPSAHIRLPVRALVPSRATYLFIEFETPDAAATAVDLLNGFALDGSRLVVHPAASLKKLFIGNIARDCPASLIHDAIAQSEPGLTSVELFEDADMPMPARSAGGGVLLHRGFCFLEFSDHASAHRVLGLLLEHGSRIIPSSAEGGEIKADWAEPLHEVAESVMAQVKILYVSNLPPLPDANEAALAAMFTAAAAGPDAHSSGVAPTIIERVKRMKNFAFVHFWQRRDAETAMTALSNAVIAGHAIKVQWSKPPPKPVVVKPAAGVSMVYSGPTDEYGVPLSHASLGYNAAPSPTSAGGHRLSPQRGPAPQQHGRGGRGAGGGYSAPDAYMGAGGYPPRGFPPSYDPRFMAPPTAQPWPGAYPDMMSPQAYAGHAYALSQSAPVFNPEMAPPQQTPPAYPQATHTAPLPYVPSAASMYSHVTAPQGSPSSTVTGGHLTPDTGAHGVARGLAPSPDEFMHMPPRAKSSSIGSAGGHARTPTSEVDAGNGIASSSAAWSTIPSDIPPHSRHYSYSMYAATAYPGLQQPSPPAAAPPLPNYPQGAYTQEDAYTGRRLIHTSSSPAIAAFGGGGEMYTPDFIPSTHSMGPVRARTSSGPSVIAAATHGGGALSAASAHAQMVLMTGTRTVVMPSSGGVPMSPAASPRQSPSMPLSPSDAARARASSAASARSNGSAATFYSAASSVAPFAPSMSPVSTSTHPTTRMSRGFSDPPPRSSPAGPGSIRMVQRISALRIDEHTSMRYGGEPDPEGAYSERSDRDLAGEVARAALAESHQHMWTGEEASMHVNGGSMTGAAVWPGGGPVRHELWGSHRPAETLEAATRAGRAASYSGPIPQTSVSTMHFERPPASAAAEALGELKSLQGFDALAGVSAVSRVVPATTGSVTSAPPATAGLPSLLHTSW